MCVKRNKQQFYDECTHKLLNYPHVGKVWILRRGSTKLYAAKIRGKRHVNNVIVMNWTSDKEYFRTQK